MNQVPDRWLAYSPVGQQISGTRFIAFKVPLKEAICKRLKSDEWFTPAMLRESCPRLALVVDLTNTKRYYNRQEFDDHGIRYRKIMCPGKIVPPADLVDRFFEIVDTFLEQNDEADSLIGVHCTHGLNRTAYFVCSYMIRRMGFKPEAAISAFEDARGHAIERLEYLEALSVGAGLPPAAARSALPLPPP
ncbi:RNA/RNP complex-1-interacting phosphatase, partial [Schistocerca nitens]|uniref:RNA/RNP complex-1-interacting phosphatase n=1 Tax=Schistocerca nitens TaxID=7011 RepID=UPI002119053D